MTHVQINHSAKFTKLNSGAVSARNPAGEGCLFNVLSAGAKEADAFMRHCGFVLGEQTPM
jgi:hypothetical protein